MLSIFLSDLYGGNCEEVMFGPREEAAFIQRTWLVVVVELDHSRLLANNQVLL